MTSTADQYSSNSMHDDPPVGGQNKISQTMSISLEAHKHNLLNELPGSDRGSVAQAPADFPLCLRCSQPHTFEKAEVLLPSPPANIHDDPPSCLQQPPAFNHTQTQPATPTSTGSIQHSDKEDLIIFHKNAGGLYNNDRLQPPPPAGNQETEPIGNITCTNDTQLDKSHPTRPWQDSQRSTAPHTTVCISTGGGRGQYSRVDGDLPTCMKHGASMTLTTTPPEKPQQNRKTEKEANHHNFILIHKNARSMTTDDAIDELLTELDNINRDVIAINETWRTTKHELWTTQQGHHLFAGSGNDTNTRGVGFLIHSRWKNKLQRFAPVNERLAYIDIDIYKWKLRIITACFPHSGYCDAHVQRMYDTLSDLRSDALQKKRHTLITGDFNAQVGSRDDDESKTTIGNFGYGATNLRGAWLKTWAAKEHYVISNTHFRKQPQHMTTYMSPSKTQYQIKYILVPPRIWSIVSNAQSTHFPDLGSDHQPVQLTMQVSRPIHKKQR